MNREKQPQGQEAKTQQQIVNAINHSLEADADTLETMADIRQRALAAIPQKPARKNVYWLSAAVAASLIAAFVFLINPSIQTPNTTDAALADMEWLLENDELELIDNELEFYQWVNEELNSAG